MPAAEVDAEERDTSWVAGHLLDKGNPMESG